MKSITAIILPMIILTVPALAQPKDEKPDGEKQICKRQEVTGSRLGATKICRTRAEWDRMADAEARNFQNARSTVVNRGGTLGN